MRLSNDILSKKVLDYRTKRRRLNQIENFEKNKYQKGHKQSSASQTSYGQSTPDATTSSEISQVNRTTSGATKKYSEITAANPKNSANQSTKATASQGSKVQQMLNPNPKQLTADIPIEENHNKEEDAGSQELESPQMLQTSTFKVAQKRIRLESRKKVVLIVELVEMRDRVTLCHSFILWQRLMTESEDHEPHTLQEDKVPTPEATKTVWESIWGNRVIHNNTRWLFDEKRSTSNLHTLLEWEVTTDQVTKAISKTLTWKAPGQDKIQNFWYKQFKTSVDQLIPEQQLQQWKSKALHGKYRTLLENDNIRYLCVHGLPPPW
ncbi:unnamed protein product [Acanthoscelides obtectus]|uniref:Uncharacterized protein n=1 Tax=Acanthoscelides obtectus TaxID=200917 RepID=A0A9P0K8Y3_ACAOB|nr:unnamed protein product [Acanthoscelides obtectus]CAK1633463.1 hypothetical protein AOBTE_LOCUS8156 [Acanthoscelides obtectus]